MKKMSLVVLFSLSAMTTAAFAQSDQGVTSSTDPAKISDIEQRAQALQSQQASQPAMPAHPSHKSMHHKKAMKHAAPAEAASQ
jgi:hypothetical protein